MRYKQPAKFTDAGGNTLPTKRVRIAEYMLLEIEEYARQLHEEKVRLGLAPIVKK